MDNRDHVQTRDIARLLRLLGTAWLLEPDETMLGRLAVLEPLQQIATTITPAEAALEYSQVILQQVPPYASLFLDEKAMLNGNWAEQALLAYNRYDFEIRREWRAGPADHLGVELHFLAQLLIQDSDAWRRILADQILPWAPLCCLAVERIEHARLYGKIAQVTLASLLSLSSSDTAL